MNYWLLTTEYPPTFGGGIGTYCEQWCRILKDKGNEVTVFLPNRSVKSFQISHRNEIRVIEFSPYLCNTSAFLGYESMVSYSFAEVVKQFAIKEGTPDWIESQEYNGIAYYLLQRKNLDEDIFKDLRVIITCHAPSYLYFEYNHINTFKLPYYWIGEMEKYCVEAADMCISPSRYLVDLIEARQQISKKIEVLHNPFFPQSTGEHTVIENKAVFLAKLSPAKGILETLNCFKQLWQNGYNYKLQLIGDKTYFYHAKQCMMGQYIKAHYSSYIKSGLLELSGLLSPEDVKQEVSSAKVVLIPSTVDNFPYTVIESMSNKKVVLASKQGGHKEIIKDGINGFLFDHSAPGSYIEQLLKVFSLTKEELGEIEKNAANTIAEKCKPDFYYDRKVKLLNSLENQKTTSFFPFLRGNGRAEQITSEINTPEEPKLLSVVIPFYNMGNYIGETLTSIGASTYKDIEIIIVNDGSDDKESINVLNDIRCGGSIKIIDTPNKGLAEARNTGALTAKGEFLAFLDADDIVHQEYYARAIKILQNKVNVHFVGSWVQYFEGSTNVWPSFNPEPPYLLYHNMVNSSGLVYKKNAFLRAGLNDSQFLYGMEDYDSVINLVKNGLNGVVIPDVLFNYRVRRNSMARGFNNENKSYLYQLLADKHKSFYSNFASEIVNLLNANGPGYHLENPSLDYHLQIGGVSNSKYLRKIYSLIKHQPLLRRIALKSYNKLQLNKLK